MTEAANRTVVAGREAVKRILRQEDHRLLVIVGPCSIHDIDAAHEYARRLNVLRQELQEHLCIIMRVYFEKPRTTVGWKGFIFDPHLNGSDDMVTGLGQARQLLLDINEMGLPAATEAGQPITIAIDYHVEKPQRGIYFIAPTADYPNKPTQVWTQGEDEDSRYWFPCFDYPGQLATSEIRLRVPNPYIAISNGILIDTQEEADAKIYHWSQQQVHPTYLMTIAVGDFAALQDEWQGIPVTYYVEKGREDDARRTLGTLVAGALARDGGAQRVVRFEPYRKGSAFVGVQR